MHNIQFNIMYTHKFALESHPFHRQQIAHYRHHFAHRQQRLGALNAHIRRQRIPPCADPANNPIWGKVTSITMKSQDYDDKPYYVNRVPWVMFFHNDQALHGAFWHDRFGAGASHGCVNLAPRDARALFDWATPQLPFPDTRYVYASKYNPGTWVYVYASSG